jgi:hypothetical protein
MGKYTNLQKDIFSIFDLEAWENQSIKTYPSNFIATNSGSEFIRVSIIPRGFGINLKSISGILLVDIYIDSGSGPNRSSFIADKLDEFLVGKSISLTNGAVTQFENSVMSPMGVDKDNPTLYLSAYSIPFNYFGVQ